MSTHREKLHFNPDVAEMINKFSQLNSTLARMTEQTERIATTLNQQLTTISLLQESLSTISANNQIKMFDPFSTNDNSKKTLTKDADYYTDFSLSCRALDQCLHRLQP